VVYTSGLEARNIAFDLFWHNHNIHPFTEYRSRKQALEHFAKINNYQLMTEDEYGLRDFVATTLASPAARCQNCYKNRLDKTAQTAKKQGYAAFSTTLLASPYQKFETICEEGELLAKRLGLKFVVKDFRENFRDGMAKAREMGLYMQKYCGCIFSEEERYSKAGKVSLGNFVSFPRK